MFSATVLKARTYRMSADSQRVRKCARDVLSDRTIRRAGSDGCGGQTVGVPGAN
jgi:hypothetical protein